LIEEFRNFEKVKDNIESKISGFFEVLRRKITIIEKKTVEKVQKSGNLDKLIDSLDQVNNLLVNDNLEEKYDEKLEEVEGKIKNQRYTYICQNKKIYDDCINELKDDNKMMARNIDQATRLIDTIFDVNMDEAKLEHSLGCLTADSIKIDEKKPDFSKIHIQIDKHSDEENSVEPISHEYFDLTYAEDRKRDSVVPDTKEYLSEQMNSFYSVRDNHMYCREIDGDTFEENMVIPLKLHLQKVITVPCGTGNRVFLFGGSKDKDGSEAVSDCYEVELEKKELKHIEKMGCSKLSMAAGISPDCSHIIIAGGSEGYNSPSNSCELFRPKTLKWTRLKSLNLARMSGSLLI
jgi:hypothetical protein